MAFADDTTFFKALKQLYTDQRVLDLFYKNRPLFAMIRKNTNFGGYTKPIPLVTTHGGSPGPDLATVAANQAPLSVESFLISATTVYNIATIAGLTIALSKGAGARSFLDATRAEIDAKYEGTANFIAAGLYGDGSYTSGQIGSVTVAAGKNVATVQLADITSVVNFEKKFLWEFRATSGGTLITDAGANGGSGAIGSSASGQVVFTSIDRQSGQVVFSGTATTDFSNLAAGQYINVSGNSGLGTAASTISTTNNKAQSIYGLGAINPVTAPTPGTTLWGVDISTDTRLSGLRFDARNKPVKEGILGALSTMWREGARPDKVFVNAESWSALLKGYEGQSVVFHNEVPVGKAGGRVYHVGFDGIKMAYPNGFVEVYADPWCPGKTARILQMENICLESAGPAPQVTRGPDGLEFLRVPASQGDAFEVRFHAYCQMSCNAPGHLGVVQLSA